jgi:hypothetical protein
MRRAAAVLPALGRRVGAAAVLVALAAFSGALPATWAGAAAVMVAPPAFSGAALAADVAPAPADTLERFLGGLSDSTDAYFGLAAEPADTAGLDSALAFGLEHPRRERVPLALSFAPDLGFDRVDGGRFGGTAGAGRGRLGRLHGKLLYTNGPNDWLGGGGYSNTITHGEAYWSLRLDAARATECMDRDFEDTRLAMLLAFVSGSDPKHYLRRDGFVARLDRRAPSWRAAAGYRDALESPLRATASWNLVHASQKVIDNLPAWRGHGHEFEIEAGARTPRLPITGEARYASSSRSAGSDFEYRRTRLAVAGDFALGKALALVPQLVYGRLTGEAVPQAAFYLGDWHSIRSLPGSGRAGTGLALARLDLIEAPDLLALARIPHPAALPIQAGLFAGAGAVWGADPFGGPSRGGLDWPDQEHWTGEAGIALLYRPGLPDPSGILRFDYAWPLGPRDDRARFAFSYTRAIDLLGPLGE